MSNSPKYETLSDQEKELLFRDALEIQHLYFQRSNQLGIVAGLIVGVVASNHMHDLLAIVAGFFGYYSLGPIFGKIFLKSVNFEEWPDQLYSEFCERWDYFVKSNNLG